MKNIKNDRDLNPDTQARGRPGNRAALALIAASVLLAAVLAAGQVWRTAGPAEPAPPPPAPREKSIAVLPFVDQGVASQSQPFLPGGLHDDLARRLSLIHELKVISPSSVMAYRGTTKPGRYIGRELGVAHLLEGQVQQAGQRFRIDVQLIDAATDTELWAESYDAGLGAGALFRIQGEIARAAAAELGAVLTAGENERLAHAPTDKLDAYRAVLLSRQFERRHGFDALQRAIRHAREAIALDPDCADAHVALAVALTTGVGNGSLERSGYAAEILQSIDRALAFDPGNASAWSALGYFRSGVAGGDFTRAFETSLELNPGDARTMTWFGSALLSAGMPEKAVKVLQRALERDPLSSETLYALGSSHATLQQHERAREVYARIREIDPRNPLGYYPVGESWMEQGRLDQALYWLGQAQAIDPGDFELAAWMLFTYDNLEHNGSASGWSLWLDDSITSQPLPLAMQARHYYLNGDFELALQYANLAINLGLDSRRQSETTFMRIKRDEAISNGDPVSGVDLLLQRYPGFSETPPVISLENLQQAVHLGLLLSLASRKSEAKRLLEAAIDLYEQPYATAGPQNLSLVPIKAEALAILGRNDEALAELERIVEAGWRVNWRWSTDLNASFNSVRETAKFRQLVQLLADDIADQRARVMAMEADGTIAQPAPLPENGLLGR